MREMRGMREQLEITSFYHAHALCPMPYAPCPMPHAPCPMPHAQFPIFVLCLTHE
ncbi:histidine kinase [Nostoc sp. UHCC 0702]|nr:histidine kinase [Nostoc sp. UHCC 0702]